MPKFDFNGQLRQTTCVVVDAPTLEEAVTRIIEGDYDRVTDRLKPEGFVWDGGEILCGDEEVQLSTPADYDPDPKATAIRKAIAYLTEARYVATKDGLVAELQGALR